MIKILKARIGQGYQTLPFPPQKRMPERFRGLHVVRPEKCGQGCRICEDACPTGAVSANPLTIDLGRCVFCEECVSACPNGSIGYSQDIRMSVRKRTDLLLTGGEIRLAEAMDKKTRELFGRSLKLRVVTAGSCSGCDMETNALSNIQFDISRFGLQIVASPRHADGLIVTGPVSENMKLALEKTYAAVASPKIVIALGACAINGGPFEGSKAVMSGAETVVPVDLYIPGCPPHPMTIIDGILRLLNARNNIS